MPITMRPSNQHREFQLTIKYRSCNCTYNELIFIRGWSASYSTVSMGFDINLLQNKISLMLSTSKHNYVFWRIMSIYLCYANPMLSVALLMLFIHLSSACLIYIVPMKAVIPYLQLLFCIPPLLFSNLVCHSLNLFVHLLSFLWATCPAKLYFDCFILAMISVTPGCVLMAENLILCTNTIKAALNFKDVSIFDLHLKTIIIYYLLNCGLLSSWRVLTLTWYTYMCLPFWVFFR